MRGLSTILDDNTKVLRVCAGGKYLGYIGFISSGELHVRRTIVLDKVVRGNIVGVVLKKRTYVLDVSCGVIGARYEKNDFSTCVVS